jgi:hypothetical protein
MYFWRIEKLKAEMAARPLSDREVLPYLVVFVGLVAALTFIPQPVTNIWDGFGAVWSSALAIFGTIYLYRQNGGAGGQHFLQRYFVIGWVVFIRWLVIVFLAGVAIFGLLAALGNELEETTWYEFVFVAIVGAILYWRTGYHIRDLAQRTSPV